MYCPRHQVWLNALSLGLCRLGVAGLAPKAPGTWGSALAAVLAPLYFLPLSLPWRCAVLVLVFVIGSLAATRVERLLKQKDPGQVVVDELLGMWLTLAPFAVVTLPMLVVGFLLFRLFDIWKPWPVRQSEHWLPEGWGVMLDDVLAGLWAMLCLWGLHCLDFV